MINLILNGMAWSRNFLKSIFTIILFFPGTLLLAQNIKAIDSLEKKLELSEGIVKASIVYELVYSYLRVDNQKATRYLTIARSLAKDEKDDGARAYLSMAQGIYCGRNGMLDSAIYFLDLARNFAEKSDNQHALIRIYASLGHTYISSGKHEKGLQYMFEGLQVTSRYPDKEMEMKLRTNVAWAYLELKQFRECIRYGLQNLKLMEGSPFEWIALYTYNNVAISYGALGILDSTRYYIHKGIKAAETSNDVQSLANGYFILGTIYSNAGQYDLAIEQYLKAKPYREKVGNPLFLASDLYTLSDLYHKSGDYVKGVEAGSQALQIAEKYNLRLKFEEAYLSLAKNHEALKDFKKASNFYRLWAITKDSVYKHSNAEAIAEMKTRYETEKKEQQLALQKAELSEQKADLQLTYVIIGTLAITLVFILVIFLLLRNKHRRERELFIRDAQIQATIQSQETERRRFARDLHDGMGQLISALRLALHRIDGHATLEERLTVVTKAEALLNDMHREIRSIAFNLMPQTLVQSGLIPALKEMSSRMNDSGKIQIRVSSFDVPERFTELQEISLYRIVQEWINNIAKHGDATLIEIQFIGYEEELNVIIEDNGSGFDPAVLERPSGNGWKNIRSRLNFIKGVLDIDSRKGRRGTTFIIKVPMETHRVQPVVVTANTR